MSDCAPKRWAPMFCFQQTRVEAKRCLEPNVSFWTSIICAYDMWHLELACEHELKLVHSWPTTLSIFHYGNLNVTPQDLLPCLQTICAQTIQQQSTQQIWAKNCSAPRRASTCAFMNWHFANIRMHNSFKIIPPGKQICASNFAEIHTVYFHANMPYIRNIFLEIWHTSAVTLWRRDIHPS